MILDKEWAQRFAEEWVAAWNNRALVVEVLTFNAQRQATHGMALYGEPA